MASSVRNMKLTSVDDLFSSEESRQAERQQGEQVLTVPISEVYEFANNPYHVRQDAELMDMVESVMRLGVHTPCLARPRKDGGYELLSGHRRKLASTLAGKDTLPIIVRDIDDDTATILVVDGNIQRETILPSEKAQAYKMKIDALNRQGRRTDLTLSQVGKKLNAYEEVANNSNDSRNQIHRYIRLTELIPPVLQMVDDGKVAFRPAVELSYLSKEQQQTLCETMECEDCTPSLAQAIKMKEFSRDGKLTDEVILSIMQEEKPNQKEQFKMPKERISKYFAPGTPAQKIEDTIIKALELYRRRERQRDMER